MQVVPWSKGGSQREKVNVTFVHLFQVMRVLGLGEDIDKLAMDDEMGRKLQDLDLKTPRRGPKRKAGE